MINHYTYLEGPTFQGTTACIKKLSERVITEIEFTTDRLTNPYNLMAGSEIPQDNVRGVPDYVVSGTQSQLKQPLISNKLMRGSPKVNIRRNVLEFGISRNMKVWGKRRTRSTVFICRKGSSLATLEKYKLSGLYETKEVNKLKYNVINNLPCNNLSIIYRIHNF